MRLLLLCALLGSATPVLAADGIRIGGKQVNAIERDQGWKPRIRKSIPAIPGHTREVFTVNPTFLDTLKTLEKLGWPEIDWSKKPAKKRRNLTRRRRPLR